MDTLVAVKTISNVQDGKTPIVKYDEELNKLFIGDGEWQVMLKDDYDKLSEAFKENVKEKVSIQDDAFRQLLEMQKTELQENIDKTANEIYASQTGESKSYSYNSTIYPIGKENAVKIDELLNLASEKPCNNYRDVYRLWKKQINDRHTWENVVESKQSALFNDMSTGSYYRFVYDEEKKTAFWVKGANTALSKLWNALLLQDGEIITNEKLHEIINSSSDFQQFKVEDEKRKSKINEKFEKLDKSISLIDEHVGEHNNNLNIINEWIKNPVIDGRLIEDGISEAKQAGKDASNELEEYKKSNLEKIKGILGETMQLSSNLSELEKKTATDLLQVKKEVSMLVLDVDKIGDLRNGNIVGGVNGNIQLNAHVTYAQKDVTQIAIQNDCIRWYIDDNYTNGVVGGSYGISKDIIMAGKNQRVSVACDLDKEKLLAIISPGLNMYVDTNFVYRDGKLIVTDKSASKYLINVHILNDGIEVTDNCTIEDAVIQQISYKFSRPNSFIIDWGDVPANKEKTTTGRDIEIWYTVNYNSQKVNFKQILTNSGGVIYDIQFTPEVKIIDNKISFDGSSAELQMYKNGKPISNCKYNCQFGTEGEMRNLSSGRYLYWKGSWDADMLIQGTVNIPDVGEMEVYKIIKNGGG